MTSILLAGHASCREFAKSEMLADVIAARLPDFRVTKVLKSLEEWDEFIAGFKQATGGSSSPVICRLLGEGNPDHSLLGDTLTLSPFDRNIGDYAAFAEMARSHYGIEHSIEEEEVDLVVNGNMEAVTVNTCQKNSTEQEIVVCVDHATSTTSYQLLWSIIRGEVFGMSTPVSLRLLDSAEGNIPSMLAGLKLELEDCAMPLVESVECSCNPSEAMADIDVAVLTVEALSSTSEAAEGTISKLKALGEALRLANSTVKVLVVGESCNICASVILKASEPSLSPVNFSTLTRIPQMRAQACIAARLNSKIQSKALQISGDDISNVIIWGGDSPVVTPDLSHAVVRNAGSSVGLSIEGKLSRVLQESEFVIDHPSNRNIDGDLKPESLLGWVRERNLAVTSKGGGSLAMLASLAIVSHLKDWVGFAAPASLQSLKCAGLYSTNSPLEYGLPPDIFFGLPVESYQGEFKIKSNLADAKVLATIKTTSDQILKETSAALRLAGFAPNSSHRIDEDSTEVHQEN